MQIKSLPLSHLQVAQTTHAKPKLSFNLRIVAVTLITALTLGCNSQSKSVSTADISAGAEVTAESSVTPQTTNVDILIANGDVYLGDSTGKQALDVGVCGNVICALIPSGTGKLQAKRFIDAQGKIVNAGFIDPHTHTLAELGSKTKNANLNYLMQGVTTVVNGNDGGSPVDIAKTASELTQNGIGTNVAFFIGHNSVRTAVMGRENRHASPTEIAYMEALVEKAMLDGAVGLSSGLYYVPGSYANTEEVIALARVAAKYNGIYDTHLRDESTFNIGFLAAMDEAINIAEQADIHLHLAHIKALGVDVWGQSKDAIKKVESAQERGVSISADQYPWLASGTKLHSAIMPKWVMAGSKAEFYQRLNLAEHQPRLQREIKENIRRRGGPSALLITEFSDQTLVGKTLEQVAEERNLSPVDTAIALVQLGDIRVASFNMSADDLANFVVQPWVVTSSDGTNGHPRKYGSFPKKYQDIVLEKQLLSLEDFIIKSSSQTADILGLQNRGKLKHGFAADIIVWDKNAFRSNATFQQWNNLASGIQTVIVNGQIAVDAGEFQHVLAGEFVKRTK